MPLRSARLLLTASLLASAGLPALAQEPSAEPSSFFQLPRVFVDNLTAEVTADGTVRGSFTFTNEEPTLQTDLRYEIFLLDTPSTAEDLAPLLYDRFVSPPPGASVSPKGTQDLSFTYSPPDIPRSDYYLRVRAITSQGRELGWAEIPVTLGNPDTTFLLIRATGITFPDGTRTGPLDGAHLSAGQTATLQATVRNPGATPLTATPALSVSRWDVTKDKGQRAAAQLPITVNAGEEREFTVPFTAPPTPDAYHLVLTLETTPGTRRSNLALYRAIVTGASGKVVTADFERLAQKAGESSVVTTTVIGSADGETPVRGRVRVAIRDGSEAVAEETFPVDLSRGPATIRSTLTLPRDIRNPEFLIGLTDERGVTLDIYSPATALAVGSVPTQASPTRPLSKLLVWLLLGALAILLLALSIRLRKQRSTLGPIVLLVALGAATGIAGALPDTKAAGEVGEETDAGYHVLQEPVGAVSLFVNAPRHRQAYFWEHVPVAHDLQLLSSGVAIIGSQVKASIAEKGGWHTSSPYLSSTSGEVKWVERLALLSSSFPVSGLEIATAPRSQMTVSSLGELHGADWLKICFIVREREKGTCVLGRDIWNTWIKHPLPPLGRQETTSCTVLSGWVCDPNSTDDEDEPSAVELYDGAPTEVCTDLDARITELRSKLAVIDAELKTLRPCRLSSCIKRKRALAAERRRILTALAATVAERQRTTCGTGRLIARVDRADLPNSASAPSCNGKTNHGFSVPTPGQLKDGKKHTIYALALDDGKDAPEGSTLPLFGSVRLLGSPKNINCPRPPADLTAAITPVSGTVTVGQTVPITGRVLNAPSAGPAGASTARFCIDTDATTCGAPATPPGSISEPPVSTLTPGADSGTLPASWTATTIGPHTAILCADVLNTVTGEASETNNCSPPTTITVAASSGPPPPGPRGRVREVAP